MYFVTFRTGIRLTPQGLNFLEAHIIDGTPGRFFEGLLEAVAENKLRQLVNGHGFAGVLQVIGDKRPQPGIP